LGALVSPLRRLRRLERYAAKELDRREGQLEESLGVVRQLLDEATRASVTLEEQLLPRELSPPETVMIAARYAGAGPDNEVGGDWYDAITLPDGGLAMVAGDVEGHDLAAAAVMVRYVPP
jgi:serine phosphatase RsbU (regulator of sigma subunit)